MIPFFLFLSLHAEPIQTLKLVRKIPHTGYSEGLEFHQGFLWHALPTGIVKIDPADGMVVERMEAATQYSESITWIGETLWNVSFSNNGIYSKPSKGKFTKAGTVPEVHAWGIAYDGKHLIVTGDYSSKLYFMNPTSMKIERTLVVDAPSLEDLAWDGEAIWSSSFTAHRGTLFRIDPKTGKITHFYKLPNPEECPIIDGIAVHGNHLWVTGKNCPSIYLLKNPR